MHLRQQQLTAVDDGRIYQAANGAYTSFVLPTDDR